MLRYVLSFAALIAGPVWAENHAILIGASTYPNLEERFWLKGPAHDVALVNTYLTTAAPVPFSPANVTMLADGVDGAQEPTLAAIRAAFERLTETVEEDDFVYLHFSGHGTQAPALNPATELDGLDELFLPVDIGPWEDTVGAVQNALVDDEIGTMIDALRAKGAVVWAVFDSCHSGTVTRAAAGADDIRLRKLPRAALSVPDDAVDDAAQSRVAFAPRIRAESPAGDALEGGGFVAFYAAQTNETTIEKRLPRGAPDRRVQGVFTYTLFETMAQFPGLTYRQLGQEVLRKYATQNLALATPMFEGDLDSYIFSGAPADKIAQWPIREGEFGPLIRAGHLQGLSDGHLVAVLPSAASGLEAAVGYARVTYAETFTAELEPIAQNGLPVLDAMPRGAYARAIEPPIDFSLRVGLPDRSDGVIGDALTILKEDAGARITFVDSSAEADVHLALLPHSPRPDAVWFLPGSGFFEAENAANTPSVGTADRSALDLAAVLQDNLTRMGRAVNLMRMAGRFNGGAEGLELTLRTRNRVQRALRDLDMTAVPLMVPEDQVHVLARNTADYPVDLNVLHIGSDYTISHFFNGRLNPGDTLKKGLFKITNTAFGRDRVVIVASPATPQTAIEDLRFLAQEGVDVRRGGGEGPQGFVGMLKEAGFGTVTRGAMLIEDDSGPAPAILQFEIDTVPGG